MPDPSDFWYRLGYALESARHGQARATLDALSGPPARRKDGRSRLSLKAPPAKGSGPGEGKGDDGAATLDLLLAAGTGTVVARLLRAWPARRHATVAHLLRAAAAGAGATVLRAWVQPLLEGRLERPAWDDASADRVASGVARGLIYGALLDPRLPGPPVVRGAAFGAAEYLLSPWGGLRSVLSRHTPYRKIPLLPSLLDDPEAGEEAFLEHLVFGVAVGLLYGGGDDVRIGMGDEAS